MTEEKTPEATASDSKTPKRDASPDASTPNGEAQARKRRRRGSRGGRNRRKSGASANATATAGAHPPSGEPIGEDWNDPAADRGMTAEDIAADAREEAGLPATTPDALKPKIGDSRPAPPAASPAKPARRRRRGGRGRRRGGGGGATTDDVVRADLAVGDAVDLEDLDEETLARRRGRTRKGRPAGRYLMCVHVRPDGHTHIALLEGRVLIEHEVAAPTRDSDTTIDGNIYLGRVQNVLPGMEAAFVDIGTPKNGVLYRGDVAYDPDEVEEKQPRIERLLKNGQNVIVQVTKNPIGAKGARLTQEVSLAGR